MKTIICMMILSFNFYAAAQVGTDPAPLKPGNRWVYNSYIAGDYAHPEIHQYEVTDSIKVINGIPFYTIIDPRHQDYAAGYYGITFTHLFARYDETISDSLYTYFKMNPQKGDTWEQHWKNGVTLYNTIIDTQSAIVFGKNTLIYVVDRRDSSKFIGSREYWTKEYGMLDGIYEEAEDILKGCVIDGVLYGDTTVTGIYDIKQLPDEFELYQNYPNPFNPSTVISWQTGKAYLVTLKVYDLLGREIKTLIDNKYYNSGKHTIIFNGKGLSSGVYFYRLITKDFIQTKKMMLLK